jgi:hypothetical protein
MPCSQACGQRARLISLFALTRIFLVYSILTEPLSVAIGGPLPGRLFFTAQESDDAKAYGSC